MFKFVASMPTYTPINTVYQIIKDQLGPHRICDRCGDRFPARQVNCRRCVDLDDVGLEELRDKIQTKEKPLRDLRFVVITSVTVMLAVSIFAYVAVG